MKTLLAVVVVLGCHHDAPVAHPPPPPPPPPVEVSCVDVRNHGDELMQPQYGKDPEKFRKLGHAVTKHCLDDKWSVEVRACIAGAHDLDTAHHCLEKMTPEQRTAFETALRDASQDPVTVVADPSGLPPSCLAYRKAVEQMLMCDKLPQASKDAMKEALDAAWQSWKDTPQDAKPALESGCSQAADAVKQAMASLSCS